MLHTTNLSKKIIVFDLDGTLLNIDDRWYNLHVFLANKYQFDPIPKKTYIHLKKNKVPEKEIVHELISNIALSDYLNDRLRHIEKKQFLTYDKVKEDVKTLLLELSKEYSLILLTKRQSEVNVLQELHKFKIDIYFEHIYISQIKTNKVKQLSDKYKNQLLCLVGDTEDDYNAAKMNNIPIILVADGSSSKNILSRLSPDYLSDTITDIQTYLKKLNN